MSLSDNLEDPLHFCQVDPTSSKQFLILKERSMVVKANPCYQQSNNQMLTPRIFSFLLKPFHLTGRIKEKKHMVLYVLDHFPMCQRGRRQKSIQLSPGSISTGFETSLSVKVMHFTFCIKSRANPDIWNQKTNSSIFSKNSLLAWCYFSLRSLVMNLSHTWDTS